MSVDKLLLFWLIVHLSKATEVYKCCEFDEIQIEKSTGEYDCVKANSSQIGIKLKNRIKSDNNLKNLELKVRNILNNTFINNYENGIRILENGSLSDEYRDIFNNFCIDYDDAENIIIVISSENETSVSTAVTLNYRENARFYFLIFGLLTTLILACSQFKAWKLWEFLKIIDQIIRCHQHWNANDLQQYFLIVYIVILCFYYCGKLFFELQEGADFFMVLIMGILNICCLNFDGKKTSQIFLLVLLVLSYIIELFTICWYMDLALLCGMIIVLKYLR